MFWKNHDPTVCHKPQYMSVIFYNNEEHKILAEKSREERQKQLKRQIVTKILPLEVFYEAEDYHQKYILRNNPDVFYSLGLDGKDLIKSYVAARINGYLGGYSTLSSFNSEWEKYGITEHQAENIQKEISRKSSNITCSINC